MRAFTVIPTARLRGRGTVIAIRALIAFRLYFKPNGFLISKILQPNQIS